MKKLKFFLIGMAIGAIFIACLIFAEEKMQSPQLDESTMLKLQNIQLQIQVLQMQAQNIATEAVRAKGLNPSEWTLDMATGKLNKVVEVKK